MRTTHSARLLSRARTVVAIASVIALLTVGGASGAPGSADIRANSVGPALSLSMTGFSPTSGPVGTPVTITGSGFTSGDLVRFHGTPVTSAKASADGTTLKVSVPAFATSGPITVTNTSTGHTVGLPGTAFQVTAGIAATHSVWPGGHLVVTGSALSPDQRVDIRVGGALLGTAVTDAHGDFQVGVTMPFDQQSGRTLLTVPNAGRNVSTIIFVFTDWPQERHDERGTGYDTFEQTLSPVTAPSLKQHWADGCCESTGVSMAYGSVFTGINALAGPAHPFQPPWALFSARKLNGAGLWAFQLGNLDSVFGTPAVANGVMYDGDRYGDLYALDAKTGAEIWASALPNGFGGSSSPTVANGVVYVQTHGLLNAVDATTGALQWSQQPGVSTDIGSPPTVVVGGSVAGGEVLAGESDGNLYAYIASTGALLGRSPGAAAPNLPSRAGSCTWEPPTGPCTHETSRPGRWCGSTPPAAPSTPPRSRGRRST